MDQNEVLKDNSAVRDEKNRIRKAQRQSKLLDVKKLMKEPFTLTVILLITLFLLLFVVYPLLNLFVGAFSKSVKVGTVDGIAVREDQFSFENFTYIFSKIYFGDAIKNSMKIGLIVAFGATLFGFFFAYVEVYVKFKSKIISGLFRIVSLLPTISPPFLIAIAIILLFGNNGIITNILVKVFGMERQNLLMNPKYFWAINLLSDIWQGMGYNSRAKRLQECARIICERHGGVMPRSYEELVALPGIGPATAAGIRAFAYDEPGVYLETNVRTVFLHELFPGRDQVDDRELIPLVRQTCPAAGEDVRGGYYALLDYGAHLKKTLPNPSRRSKHHSRQSEFQGSNRQKRSFVLRCVLESPQTALQLQEALDAFELAAGRPRVAPAELSRILEKLEEEGLIQQKGGLWLVG